jgi:hypothetical protein
MVHFDPAMHFKQICLIGAGHTSSSDMIFQVSSTTSARISLRALVLRVLSTTDDAAAVDQRTNYENRKWM